MKVEVEQLKQVAGRIREKLLDFRLSDAEVGGDGNQARSPYVVPLDREVGGMINPEKVWLDLRPSDWVITLSVRKSDSGLDRKRVWLATSDMRKSTVAAWPTWRRC